MSSGPPPGHDSPYPGSSAPHDDPRPWWFREFAVQVLRELGELKDDVHALQADRDTRKGVALTWRQLAGLIVAVSGVLTIIILLITLIERLPA